MPPRWLYAVDGRGIALAPRFADRLKRGDASALSVLSTLDLTALYRRNYMRLGVELSKSSGLFWSDATPHVTIPLVHSGRRPPQAWLHDFIAMRGVEVSPGVIRDLRGYRKMLTAHEGFRVKIKRNNATAVVMKPNPKVELVVVNRHDRSALLKLLGEVDPAANVRQWLATRTRAGGSTLFKELHADYERWCARHSERAAKTRSFAAALLAAGVEKGARTKAGWPYRLTLRDDTKRLRR